MSTPTGKIRNGKPTKKLTEFFTARQRASSGAGAALSSSPAPASSKPKDASGAATRTANPTAVVATLGQSTLEQTSDAPAHTVVQIRQTRARGPVPCSEPTQVDPMTPVPLRRSTRKASTPTIHNPLTSPTTTRKTASTKPGAKRKAMSSSPSKPARAHAWHTLASVGDSNPSCVLPNTPSAKAKDPPRTSPRKRRKLSSSPAASVLGERVASSLSDEEEMTLATPKPDIAKDPTLSVEKWRQQDFLSTVPSPVSVTKRALAPMDMDSDTLSLPALTFGGKENAMDVSDDVPCPVVAHEFGLTRSSSRSSILTDLTEDSDGDLAPPSTPLPMPLPPAPTPKTLDVESKTAKLIADIRAKAYATYDLSDEEPRIRAVVGDLNDSDSEPEDFFVAVKQDMTKGKAKESPSPSPAEPPAKPSPAKTTRYSLRTRAKLSPDPSSRSPITAEPLPRLSALRSEKPKRPTKTSDPLEFLLREKRAADRKGKGAGALRAAEDTLARCSPDAFGEGDWWDDEEAARRTAIEGARIGLSSASPPAHTSARSARSVDVEDEMEEEDARRLLGSEQGKAVGRILEKDRSAKRNEKAVGVDMGLGVRLWRSPSMLQDLRECVEGANLPPLDIPDGAGSILRMLGAAVGVGDSGKISTIIDSGALAGLSTTDRATVLPWFIRIALTDADPRLIECALRALPIIMLDRELGTVSLLPAFVAMLRRLGAAEDALAALGIQEMLNNIPPMAAFAARADAICSYIAVVNQCARARKIPEDDLANIVISLLMVALDVECSPSRKRDVMIALEYAGRCIPSAQTGELPSPTEQAMAQRVLAYASNLTLANKARFLSFFAGGCPQTSRIARWLAHAILLGAAAPPYSGLPPLEPLKNLLSSPAQIGEICSDTDYDELCCRIDILAVALTGIDEYVAEERRLARLEKVAQYSTSPASPGRLTREKLPTPLEAIRMALDSLNGRIVDTQAAHLERSRTKAAIQRLAMRVHYQQLGASGTTAGMVGKPRRIGDFFPTPLTANVTR